MNIQIIGMVRFSYPALSGFVRTGADAKANAAFLYDPARLEARFQMFERLTLPSIRAQTDGDFTLGILIGDNLPGWARDRLCTAIAGMRNVRLLARPPGPQYPVLQDAMAALRLPDATHIAGFRLDDDDALSMTFVERLRPLASIMAGQGAAPKVIAFNRGFFLELGDMPDIYDVCERSPLGIGLTLVAPVANHDVIFRRNHRYLPQFYTTFSDAEHPSFIRTVHRHNDSSAISTGLRGTWQPEQITRQVARHFPFTVDELLSLPPAGL
ncbi:glycosyltransferase [Paracoccus sp. p3-h83]|uniref:glycosyltransferase n=1 Tax=Paracoccus sp. p3-h83 TaxID=3342805 RepID=UPI0035B6E027